MLLKRFDPWLRFLFSWPLLLAWLVLIMAGLVIAAVALLVWLLVEPGVVRDVALVITAICGVSTVLFNGNPLLRFDAYYVLCDALDLPNLAIRSHASWRYLLINRVLGIPDMPSPEPGRGEGPWLYFYAPASALYRISISLAIVGWIGSWSMALGLLAGAGVVFAMLVTSVFQVWRSCCAWPCPISCDDVCCMLVEDCVRPAGAVGGGAFSLCNAGPGGGVDSRAGSGAHWGRWFHRFPGGSSWRSSGGRAGAGQA